MFHWSSAPTKKLKTTDLQQCKVDDDTVESMLTKSQLWNFFCFFKAYVACLWRKLMILSWFQYKSSYIVNWYKCHEIIGSDVLKFVRACSHPVYTSNAIETICRSNPSRIGSVSCTSNRSAMLLTVKEFSLQLLQWHLKVKTKLKFGYLFISHLIAAIVRFSIIKHWNSHAYTELNRNVSLHCVL